jgi:hypothetical protein
MPYTQTQPELPWSAPRPVEREPDITGMTHRGDPSTSREAATAVARRRTELHAAVLAAFRLHGRMTDEELEKLPQFQTYGPSTIRKRRSELFQQGALVAVGDRVNSRGRKMVIWEAT